MKILTMAHTDVGSRPTNEDAACVISKNINSKKTCFAVVCDGIGGLTSGDYASKTVVNYFENWFENELESETKQTDIEVIAQKWIQELRFVNYDLLSYSKSQNIRLGTTFTGILIVEKQYLIVHVGDTRVYFIDDSINQLTEDHTLAALQQKNEIKANNSTANQLYQCIGANNKFKPQVIIGKLSYGTFIVCSDGFRHKISDNELLEHFKKSAMRNRSDSEIKRTVRSLVKTIKERGEKDNISVILINVSEI